MDYIILLHIFYYIILGSVPFRFFPFSLALGNIFVLKTTFIQISNLLFLFRDVFLTNLFKI